MKYTNYFLSKMQILLLMLQEVVPVVAAELLVHYSATEKTLRILRKSRFNLLLINLFTHS